MAKRKKSSSWMWLVGAGAAAWYFFSGSSASAATSTTVSAGAQTYMNQIMAAQNAFTSGSQTQAQYVASAQAILAKALLDSNVSSADMATLHAVSGN
jgi:aerobic-type carbon monoxide dehydrogenase small subunit (CoxS/CutS family)